MLDRTRVKDGLSRFADLDCVVRAAEISDQFVVQLAQQGEQVVVGFDADGKVTERREGEVSGKYSSYRGLLASRHFGNIRRLVDAQKALLLKDAPYFSDIQGHLPIVGNLEATASPSRQKGLLDDVDEWLLTCGMSSVRTLVIDGPAGVGKSHLIRRLVHDRANNFGPGSSPPILHIRSKGRKLTTLTDVIAGSLQELRLSLTFDQLPVLIREGLIGIAIDGFDELADPNGYENSWACSETSLKKYVARDV